MTMILLLAVAIAAALWLDVHQKHLWTLNEALQGLRKQVKALEDRLSE
jgi:hypothetical protein